MSRERQPKQLWLQTSVDDFVRQGAAAQRAVDELGAGRPSRALELANRLRSLASSSRFDGLAIADRKELRAELYELADDMEDL